MPIVLIDFDGCIHSYEQGWQDGRLYGHVLPGFWSWLEQITANGFAAYVYSSRSKTSEGRYEMIHWLRDAALREGFDEAAIGVGPQNGGMMLWLKRQDRPAVQLGFTAEKLPAFVTIDDRAIQFNGNWQAAELDPDTLPDFKPYMVRK